MVEPLSLRTFGAFAYNTVGRKKLLQLAQGFTEPIWAQ